MDELSVFKFPIIDQDAALYCFAKNIGNAVFLAAYLSNENPEKYPLEMTKCQCQEGDINIPEATVYFVGLQSVHPIAYIQAMFPKAQILNLN